MKNKTHDKANKGPDMYEQNLNRCSSPRLAKTTILSATPETIAQYPSSSSDRTYVA